MRTWPSPEIGEMHNVCRRLNAIVGKHVEAGRRARLDGDERTYELHALAAREVLGVYYEAELRLLGAIQEARA